MRGYGHMAMRNLDEGMGIIHTFSTFSLCVVPKPRH